MNAQTDSAKFGEFLAATEKGGSSEFDPSDWLRQLQAMMRHGVAASADGSLASIAQKIKAKMLIVVAAQDHMVNPEPATKVAEVLGAQLITLTGDCGHLAPGCEAGKLNPLVAEFLSQKLP